MKKNLCFTVCLALMVAAGGLLSPGAEAQSAPKCAIGPGLGATLLFPYFEVDLNNPSGITALISINNGLGDSSLARVTLWTDWGVATMAFDIYLERFDLVTINIRDLFNGSVPSTGAGANLSKFPGCDSAPPTYSSPVGTSDDRAQLRADHTGESGPIFADCIGSQYGDSHARGYITVDAVSRCSGAEVIEPAVAPGSNLYFSDVADVTNRFWGDVIQIDTDNGAAQGSGAIPIWADPFMFSGPDVYTFYGRFHNWDGSDSRVPLPYRWDQRFLNGGPFAGGADVIVYRDPGRRIAPAACGPGSDPFPLPANVIALDEDGDNLVNASGANAVGLATQRTPIGDFSIPYSFGWIQIDTFPFGSWAQPTLTASGLFSAGFNGTAVETLCNRIPPSNIRSVSENQKRKSKPVPRTRRP